MRIAIAAVGLAFLCTACGGRRVKLDREPVVAYPGVVEVSAEWVKDKRRRFDVLFFVRNLRGDALVLKRRDITCARGERAGDLDMDDDAVQELGPGETRRLLGKCDLGDVADGPFILRFDAIYVEGEDAPIVRGLVFAVDEFGALAEMADQGRPGGVVAEKTTPPRAAKTAPRPRTKAPPQHAAAPVAEHSLEAGASEMAVKRYLIARELYLQGNLEGAASEFQGAFDIFPESAKLAFNLARCHERLGNSDRAIVFYEKYLERAPANAADREDIERLLSALKKRNQG